MYYMLPIIYYHLYILITFDRVIKIDKFRKIRKKHFQRL